MNKTVKIILIIAACLIPAGLLIAGLGFFMGGKGGWSLNFSGGKPVVGTDVVEETIELKDFDRLELEISSADANIMRGDSYAISYKVRKGEEPGITEDGGILTVKQPEKGFVMFDFGSTKDLDVYTITIPDTGKITDLEAKVSSGDILIDSVKVSGSVRASSGNILLNGIEGDELSVETSSGDINGDKVKAAKSSFSASSGDVTILRLDTDEVNCKTSSGEIGLFDSVAANVTAKASSGDIDIELNGKFDEYSFRIDTTSGDIKVNGDEHEKEYVRDNGTDKKIDLSATSGDVEVNIN